MMESKIEPDGKLSRQCEGVWVYGVLMDKGKPKFLPLLDLLITDKIFKTSIFVPAPMMFRTSWTNKNQSSPAVGFGDQEDRTLLFLCIFAAGSTSKCIALDPLRLLASYPLPPRTGRARHTGLATLLHYDSISKESQSAPTSRSAI